VSYEKDGIGWVEVVTMIGFALAMLSPIWVPVLFIFPLLLETR
jgi:hypothetical protein